MKVLFIFDDGKNSTFYLYFLENKRNQLIHFVPEIPIQNLTLGELYQQNEVAKFLRYFSAAFSIPVEHYLVMEKAQGLAAVKEAGLNVEGKFLVENPSDFTAVNNQVFYPKGPLALDYSEVVSYVSWQIDQDGTFGVFTRQEDVIRYMKQRLLKPSLGVVTKHFGKVEKQLDTNLGMRQVVALARGYLAKGDQKMMKQTVPKFGTYQVPTDSSKKLIIDWQQNPIQLVAALR